MRSSVVLPAPFGPTIATRSPARSWKLHSSRTSVSPYSLTTPLRFSIGLPATLPRAPLRPPPRRVAGRGRGLAYTGGRRGPAVLKFEPFLLEEENLLGSCGTGRGFVCATDLRLLAVEKT